MSQWVVRAIDDQPARRGGGAVERHAHQLPGGAAAAVAADDVARADRCTAIGELDRDTVGCFGAVLHQVTPPHFDTVEAVNADKQFGVHHGLDEAVALGPSEAGVRRRHLRQQLPLRVEEPQDLVGHGVGQDLLHQADRLERPQRLVVQADAAWIVDEAVSLVDHQHADTLLPKDVRQGEPDRARPDDDDVHLFGHSHRPRRKSRWSRLKVFGSSYCGQ